MAPMSELADRYQEAWLKLVNQMSGDDRDAGIAFEAPVQETFQRAATLLENFGQAFIRTYPLVTAVALSLRYVRGEIKRDEPCITFFVAEKLPRELLRPESVIPSTIEGVPTDVIEAGTPRLAAASWVPGIRLRPAEPGASVSHIRVSSGTFGCLVQDRQHQQYILSCAHVLSDATGVTGDLIVQPGTTFGGPGVSNQIASLTATMPLPSSGLADADAALAQVSHPAHVTATIRGIGNPTGTRTITGVGTQVQKSGDATGVTRGVIIGIKGTIGPLQVNGVPNVYFCNSIITTPMSDAGDSGALLLDNPKKAIGLLFGGLLHGGVYVVSWYNPIDIILSHFGVTLV